LGGVIVAEAMVLAQNLGPSTGIEKQTNLVGTQNFPGGWSVVNGEKGVANVQDGVLRITPSTDTNLFRSPGGNFDVMNAPMVLFAPAENFTLKAKISAQLADAYDVGAMVLYEDDMHWAKLCFENSGLHEATIVSVVTRERSDDVNSETIASPFAYMAIARKGNEFSMHFSRDGQQWGLVRHFQVPFGAKLRVGFTAHTFSNKQFSAGFSEIVYRATAPENMRQLKQSEIADRPDR
jgi:regulation of enolase protein 1 (concanavalin A-like superfamily)